MSVPLLRPELCPATYLDYIHYNFGCRFGHARGRPDDLLGGGYAGHPEFEPPLQQLRQSFSFRDFRFDQEEFEILGAKVSKLPEGGHRYGHVDYLRKIKPIQIDNARAADPSLPVTESERSQLRTIGALATRSDLHVHDCWRDLLCHGQDLAGRQPSTAFQQSQQRRRSGVRPHWSA